MKATRDDLLRECDRLRAVIAVETDDGVVGFAVAVTLRGVPPSERIRLIDALRAEASRP